MRYPKRALTTLLLCLLVVVAGCAQTGSSGGICSGPYIRANPAQAAPAGTFRLQGRIFSTSLSCEDSGKPLHNIPIGFRQDGETWRLATVDAAADYTFDVKVRVPADAKPGAAVVTATSSVGEKKQRFRVLGGSTGKTP